MRKQLIVLGILLHFAVPAPAQVSFGFGFQTDNISISLSTYPNLVRVPGYPVYYASGLNSNYFFYDGLYWVFETDRWYSSSWYNGPWMMVEPEYIPVYLLRVPVRYYRRPPDFFVGWQANSPPRWGDHWGNDWAQHRSGWDRWDRRAMPAPAPLPTYQRQYSGDRYPSRDQQPVLQQRNYRHEARDPLVRQQFQAAPPPRSQPEQAPRGREESQQRRNPEPSAAPPRPAPAVRQEAPATPQARQPQPQREREIPEQRQPQAAPRVEQRSAPRDNPQPQRELQREPNRENMRPQPEQNQQRGQPSNEARPAPRQQEAGQHPGQRSGQQRERDDSDERGQGRGR
ncbi:hypothetical protein [Ferribacterium limneticum]|uniref:hypothetical protein n=1 Tax=Ferribacterium limneticum TaxID=76259 RepID=UPI001CF889C2|nr:hypothetical protein [Ferribacterium limneticum]UCV24595.1 hypothetical protein KI613_08840 [Ferribacterium limneticum]